VEIIWRGGRAALRSPTREYLCSEAMHGLGIPTTRALALCGSGDPGYRGTAETAPRLSTRSPAASWTSSRSKRRV